MKTLDDELDEIVDDLSIYFQDVYHVSRHDLPQINKAKQRLRSIILRERIEENQRWRQETKFIQRGVMPSDLKKRNIRLKAELKREEE